MSPKHLLQKDKNRSWSQSISLVTLCVGKKLSWWYLANDRFGNNWSKAKIKKFCAHQGDKFVWAPLILLAN